MKLNLLTAAYFKKYGFNTKNEGIKFVLENVAGYRGMGIRQLDVVLAEAVRKHNADILEAERADKASRELTNATLRDIDIARGNVVAAIEYNEARVHGFRPVYLQLKREVTMALVWSVYIGYTAREFREHMPRIIELLRAYNAGDVDAVRAMNGMYTVIHGSHGHALANGGPDWWLATDAERDEVKEARAYHVPPPAVPWWRLGDLPEFDDLELMDWRANINVRDLLEFDDINVVDDEVVVHETWQRGDPFWCAMPQFPMDMVTYHDGKPRNPASETYATLGTLAALNTVAYSQVEVDTFKNTIVEQLSDMFRFWLTQYNPGRQRDGFYRIRGYERLLARDPDVFETYPLFIDDELRIQYVLNGHYFDFGEHMMNKFAEEAPPYRMRNGRSASCVIGCIASQCTVYLGVKRMNKLLEFNDARITIETLESIAKALNMRIQAFDLECKKWCDYDYTTEQRHKSSARAMLIIKNNHAFNVKQQYRIHTELSPNPHGRPGAFMNVMEHAPDECHYGEAALDNCGAIVFDGMYDMDTVPTGVYFAYDEHLCSILYLLIACGVHPTQVIVRNVLRAIGFRINDRLISIRIRESDIGYHCIIPRDHNMSLTSAGLYLFRTFITSPLCLLTDPTVIRAFKSMCAPLIDVNTCDHRGNCYIIDINKAYRALSGELGVFNGPPTITRLSALPDPLVHGVYYFADGWRHWFDIQYDIDCGVEVPNPLMMIAYDGVTNVVSEFGTALYANALAVETDPDHRKFMFNSLIGAFNPSQDERPNSIILKTKQDLSRFMLNQNKAIQSIARTPTGQFIVVFNYDDDFVRGNNLTYLTAQIVSRCRLLIRKVRDVLVRACGATIVGTMTDSVIFHTPKPVNFNCAVLRDVFTIGTEPGQFSVKQGNYLLSVGPGRYGLYNGSPNARKVVTMKCQGVKREQQSTELLQDMFRRRNGTGTLTTGTCMMPPLASEHLHDLFIGEAGVGKSRYINDNYHSRRYVRLGSTGLAASAIGGQTVHSFFGLGETSSRSLHECITALTVKKRVRMQTCTHIIIDECYMLGARVMRLINNILKVVCGSVAPFGGKHMLFFGDDRQLMQIGDESFFDNPPIAFNRKIIPYDREKSRLEPMYRCKLAYLRKSDLEHSALRWFIMTLQTAPDPHPGAVWAYYLNADVHRHNQRAVARAPGLAATINGCQFKPGTPVMLTRNGDRSGARIRDGVYNGSMGTFVSCIDGALVVNLGEKIGDKMLNGYTSIVPAHAITIHKLQGQTLDRINICIHRAHLRARDATRLLYVALSRVRSVSHVHIRLID